LAKIADRFLKDGDAFGFLGNWLRAKAALASLLDDSRASGGGIRG